MSTYNHDIVPHSTVHALGEPPRKRSVVSENSSKKNRRREKKKTQGEKNTKETHGSHTFEGNRFSRCLSKESKTLYKKKKKTGKKETIQTKKHTKKQTHRQRNKERKKTSFMALVGL